MSNNPLIVSSIRPNRITTKNKDSDKKADSGLTLGEEYHVNMARNYVNETISHPLYQQFIINTVAYWRFYSGDQWFLEDDLEGFLTDESGARNRRKFVADIIQPMVKQLVGTAVNLNYNVKAINISPFAITRRDEELKKLLFLTKQAQETPFAKDEIQKQFGVGETEDETTQLFNNYYVDKHKEGVNNLLRWSKHEWNFEEAMTQIAKHKAISGIGIHKAFEENGYQRWEVIDPLFFLPDLSAKREDMRDSEHMGELRFGSAAELCEKFQNITDEERDALEKFTINNNNTNNWFFIFNSFNKGRIPYFEMYWEDIEEEEWGYVMDDYGYELLTRINNEEFSKYTDKHLIVPKHENHKKFLGENKKKVKKYSHPTRYCIFVPKEMVNLKQDIILEHGIYEKSEMDASFPVYPHKIYCSDYHNGEIISPIATVIDPQRLLNRSLSVLESHFNNARGSGMVYDKFSIDAQDGEAEMLRNMNLSKPIAVDTKRLGSVQNAIGNYGSNLGQQINPLIEISNLMKQITQDVSGLNDAMKGSEQGSNQLVGVQQLKIKSGNILQAKFFFGLKNIMLQSFQSVASQGVRIYADSQRRLSLIVGDSAAEDLIITKDMKLEEFRVVIDENVPDETEKQVANDKVLQLYQLGLIGDKQVSEIFNKGDMDKVAEKMVEFYNEKQMMATMKQKSDLEKGQVQAQQMEQQKQELLAEQRRQEEREDHNTDKEAVHDIDKVTAHGMVGIEKEKVKAALKD